MSVLSIIPDLRREFEFITSRSGGPGGQNTNKTETKVILRFNISSSTLLTDEQKETLLSKLEFTLIEGCILSCTSQKFRSQLQNKEHCIEKCHQILLSALTPIKKRIKTKVPKAVNEKRLLTKRINASQKLQRRKIGGNHLNP
ncbi:MAG: aminoacyl-tRNA hydrolase [Saprospiraceae bacterium]|nr:aminoacyl-tRNA hydrolase [Saprospiraceae bacterium]MBK7220838.1 aminoacyl-tRNA hydrolase [Saprospiraceae bacterium]MBK7789657.1 aminoacyl-tRNA hydrolase [Saprospiraceae bacterium]MBK8851066.1 aminoacyl-tRNA hydrolase [Saprospiraceae bacterium]MBK9689024.1 aminoacyl-tRNA hydrolase [Saprospiraceae bacterium]